MKDMHSQPWLGLSSYEERDSHIFYGRSAELEELFGDIVHNTQTVIYGPSGTGKTSILKAGIFVKARSLNYLPVYVRLNHDGKQSYTVQIINQIKTEVKNSGGEIENIVTPVANEDSSLWEFFHSSVFWSSDNYPLIPMIVVDQFEEIFTLTKDKGIVFSFFEELSDLCDNTMPEYIKEYLNSKMERREFPDTVNYRLIISLREDFLARLEEYAVDIPSFRRNRFSLQAINEEQAMEIIIKPSNKLVSEEVAIEIIKKVTNNANFKIDGIPEISVEPSLLSLFCNELNRKRIASDSPIISMDLLNEFGDNIITEYYEDTISLISEKSMLFLEKSLLTSKGYRDSVALSDALENGVTNEEIDLLQSNRVIHVDEWDGTKRVEFTHDVLCKTAKEHRDKRDEQLRLDREKEKNIRLLIELKKGRLRKRSFILGIVSLFIIIISGIWWYLDAYMLEKEAFFLTPIKQFGWFEGRNEVSKEEASHCQVYYRFSKIGSKSRHWTKMQAFDGYHKLTTEHTMATYLINQFDDKDDKADKKMKEALKSVCQWEMIADATGQFVVEERAYDREGRFIFSCKNTKLDNNKVMVSFFNEFGLPITMRTNEANYVRITYDNTGNEIFYEFYDKDGYPQHNRDGAYKTEKKYDENGFQIYEASLNPIGKKIIDDAGNCGWKARYENGMQIWQCSFNEKEEPWPTVNGNIEFHYEYDKYGNLKKQVNLDGYGNPYVDSSGIHIYIYEFNNRGKIIHIEYRDVENTLCNNSEWGYAIVNRNYDDNGNMLLEETLDKTEKCTYRLIQKYKNGSLQERNEYDWNKEVNSLQLHESYMFNDKDHLYSEWYPEDNYYNEWKYNSYGNLLYDAYFNSKDKKESINSSDGFHLHKYDYKYKPQETFYTETYLDSTEQPVVPENYKYAKKTVLIDSLNKIKINTLFDSQGDWIYTNKQQYNDDFNAIQSQVSIGLSGIPVRNGRDGAYYYKTMVEYTMNYDNFSTLVGYNEFDEPSLIEGENIVYHKQFLSNNGSIFFDEEGDKIIDMEAYISSLPKVVHLTLVDTTLSASKVGIKDGDILVQYGQWKFSFENPNIDLLFRELQRLKEKEKVISIVRHDPSKMESLIFEYTLPKGLSGINLREIYYTEDERERLETLIYGNN